MIIRATNQASRVSEPGCTGPVTVPGSGGLAVPLEVPAVGAVTAVGVGDGWRPLGLGLVVGVGTGSGSGVAVGSNADTAASAVSDHESRPEWPPAVAHADRSDGSDHGDLERHRQPA